MNLDEVVKSVKQADEAAVKQALRRWDQVAKPLNSLGVLEEDIVRIAGAPAQPRLTSVRRPLW